MGCGAGTAHIPAFKVFLVLFVHKKNGFLTGTKFEHLLN
jgi:hypothetical protein